MVDVCMVVCTFAQQETCPRTNLTKRCLRSLEKLKIHYGERLFIAAWDNHSNETFLEYLRQQSWIDRIFANDKNFFDFGAVHALSALSTRLKAPYVIYCNDDIEFFNFEFLDDSIEILKSQPRAGYIRLNLFDFNQLHIFDKASKHKDRDSANSQRMYNWVSKKPIDFVRIPDKSKYEFYSTNMHWTLFPGLCKAEIFNALCPFRDYRPLQHLEGFMMDRYHLLGLATLQLNGGVCQHLGTPELSARMKSTSSPVVSWKKTQEAIQNS